MNRCDAESDLPHLILMGTGTSVGVPVVGCTCSVCTSQNSRNQRTRSGVLVRAPDGEFVIDTGPELRLQLLQNRASCIRAAVFTHAHADHVMGLDDLRIFSFRLEKQLLADAERIAAANGEPFDKDEFRRSGAGSIPLFCEENVEEDIRQIFHYAFADPTRQAHRFAVPRLTFRRIEPGHAFELLGLQLVPIRLHHGKLPIVGYRIGDVAFCTDVSTIPADSREMLTGLDTLVIDALRRKPHPTHMHLAEALKWAERLKPRRTILTHMAHDLDYDSLVGELPDGVEPGYDGLRIDLSLPISA
ncbi:MAG: MBL fold metallo-hydrolase [Fuerstiella sp.]|nr:MBL fold metallo-hydrolase [Fuerstiella sp.]